MAPGGGVMAEAGAAPAEPEEQRELIERCIAEVGLRPYQAMVIRMIYAGENVTAALRYIEQLREVSGER